MPQDSARRPQPPHTCMLRACDRGRQWYRVREQQHGSGDDTRRSWRIYVPEYGTSNPSTPPCERRTHSCLDSVKGPCRAGTPFYRTAARALRAASLSHTRCPNQQTSNTLCNDWAAASGQYSSSSDARSPRSLRSRNSANKARVSSAVPSVSGTASAAEEVRVKVVVVTIDSNSRFA